MSMAPSKSSIEDGDGLGPPKGPLSALGQLWRYVAPYRLAVIGAVLALSLAAVTVLVVGIGLRVLVDQGFTGQDTGLLDRALLGLFVVIVVLAIATYSRYSLVSWLGERVVADIRKLLFGHVLTLDSAFFEITRVGDVLSRITTDTTLLQVIIGSSASVAMRNLLLLSGSLVMLAVTSPKLTLMVVFIAAAVVAPIVFIGRRVRRLSRTSQDRVADVGAHVEESLNAVRTIQAFCHEDIDRDDFSGRVEDAFGAAVRRIRARAALTAVVIIFVFSGVGTILWIGGHDVLAGRLSAGELSAFVFYSILMAGATGAVSEVVGDLQRAAGAMERLTELLAVRPGISAPENPVSMPVPPRGEVSFEHATFHYPSRPEMAALSDFSLIIGKGEKLALVGPSGAGKSTVFQLLLRFYDPDSGRITFDGVELKSTDPRELRGRIGLVAQDPVIFSTSGLENVRYGRRDASDQEVRAAAEAACAADFLDALPQGFDTYLGEKGIRLSGGERQRIAIARAILRDPALLLLDEATSALDAESERLVQQALARLMTGRTTVIIAHRLATVLEADRIVVMDEGRIVAQGTHQDLMAEGGLYAYLADLQFDVDRVRAGGLERDALSAG